MLDPKDPEVLQDSQDLRENLELLEDQDYKVCADLRDNKDHGDPRVRPVHQDVVVL